MNIVGIIPARLASTRFPGKPLAPILGMPMVGHVYFRSKMSRILQEVCVATCDEEIARYIESIGGRVVVTAPTHERASDRVAEATQIVEKEEDTKIEIVVLIQGDEPMMVPEMIDEGVAPLLSDPSIVVTNLLGKIRSDEEYRDVNEVKVVVDQHGFALYFSREPIPSSWKSQDDLPKHKQACVISFRRDFLSTFSDLPPMLRRIEYQHSLNPKLETRNSKL